MSKETSVTTCPVCRHHYYPEDKSTYRICSKCAAQMCTICASRNMWTCPVCRNPYGELAEPE